VPRLANKEELKLVAKRLLAINPKLKIKFLAPHKFQKISSTKIRGS